MAVAERVAPYAELVSAWRALRGPRAPAVREVACVGEPRTLLVADLAGDPGAPTVLVAAGIHGDEPAAPWALLSIVRDGLLDARLTYRFWPCTNPTGYALGTREDAAGRDLNRCFGRGGSAPETRAMLTAMRDRRYALALDLHEDFESDGFYCYEPLVPGPATVGREVVAAIEAAGYPIQELDDAFDLGYAPEATHLRALERGRVVPNVATESATFTGRLPLSMALLARGTRRTLTCETPRRLPWSERIAMHRIAVVTALASVTPGTSA